MTIGTNNRNDALGNGSTATYPYSFKVFAATDLRVTVRHPTTDVETTLTYPTHYSVTGVGAAAGGNVVLVNGAFAWIDGSGFLDDDWPITIRRVRPLTQAADIRNQGDFYPEIHEDVFDHLMMVDQQQQDELDRSFKLPETVESSEFDTTLPAGLVGAVSKALITNATGDGFEVGPTAAAISGAQASATAAAASAAAALVSETNADASADAAAASAIDAQTAVDSVMWQDVVFIASGDSPFTITEASHRGKLIAVDATGGAVSITLPQISTLDLTDPWSVGIKKTDSSGNAVTVNRSGTDTINGGTSKAIAAAGAGSTFIPDTDPAPDEWTTIDFGATAGNLTVDIFDDGADYTAGTTTQLTLSQTPGSENNVQIFFDGVHQAQDQFSLAGAVVTFSSAIPLGVGKVVAVIGTTLSIGTPSDGSVSTVKIADGAVTAAKLDDSDPQAMREVIGGVVQIVEGTPNVTYSSITTAMPYDDSIPQSGEGGEVCTVTITPTSAGSRLVIEAQFFGTSNTAAATILALFKDSDANALSAVAAYHASDILTTATLRHEMAAGGTSAITFKLRAGNNSGNTTYVNGSSGGRRMGGVGACRIKVTEIKA